MSDAALSLRARLAHTPPGYRYSIGRILAIYSGLMVTLLLAALDQTIVATALPRIVSDLGGITQYSWVFTAYMLTSTVTVPLYGKLGDVCGRKNLFLFAIVVFLIGSTLCGLAQSMTQLVIFRAVQGIGAGGLFPLSLAVIGNIVPPRDRGRWQGLIGAVFAASSIVGPAIGGFIVDNTSVALGLPRQPADRRPRAGRDLGDDAAARAAGRRTRSTGSARACSPPGRRRS